MSDPFIPPSGPDAEAYETLVNTEGYRGRFVANSANIRLFIDNPYIVELPDNERMELNQSLLKPFQGETFYDDDKFIWICHHELNQTTNEVEYKYTSTGKQTDDKLKYYESKGVLNQLMSAYNNGRVYNFYVDRANLLVYPNSNLVFPHNYHHCRIRKVGLNTEGQPVYVAGILSDGLLLEYDIAMTSVVDNITGTNYSRMGVAHIFGMASPDVDTGNYDTIVNGLFYIVEFFDENNFIVDTKQFQAVDAAVENVHVPTESVVDLKIEVLRSSFPQDAVGDIYPLLSGETLDNTISFNVIGIYGDGTRKILNAYNDTNHLVIEGRENITEGLAIGSQVRIKFTYYPSLNESGDQIGAGVTKSIYFQIIENTYQSVYRAIPVMWKASGSTLNSGVNTYKLKLFTLTSDGILENRTKSLFDSIMIFDITLGMDGQLKPFDYPHVYNPYEQCIEFSPSINVLNFFTVSFKMYNLSKLTEFRFKMSFQAGDTGTSYLDASGGASFGYEEHGILSTFVATAVNPSSILRVDTVADSQRRFELTSDLAFDIRYSRNIGGQIKYPTAFQIFVAKDSTYQPMTRVTPYTNGAKTLNGYILQDDAIVNSIISNIHSYDKILVKFFATSTNTEQCVNIDSFNISRV